MDERAAAAGARKAAKDGDAAPAVAATGGSGGGGSEAAAGDGSAGAAASDGAVDGEPPRKKKRQRGGKKGKKKERVNGNRYLLFVGNLPFSVKVEWVFTHFANCGGLMDVRILTDKVTKKPRGTCFIEFDNQEGHANALKLHHSKFSGRVINVELTVGGGGNSENRKTKLTEKNRMHLGTGGPDSINAMPLGKRAVPRSTPVAAAGAGAGAAAADSSDDEA
jgi:nucleolar protein 6